MAYIGVSPSNGVRRVHTYTATASQTTFSGAGAEGTTLSYKDSNFVDVYQNGVKLGDADYTATSGTSIVLGTGATASDLVVIVVFDVFSVADTVSKADGGTFDGAVSFAGDITDSGDLTVDVAGDIILDSDDGLISFKNGGTSHGNIQLNSDNLALSSQISDADIKFLGSDNGQTVVALTLDMSDAGKATFNSGVVINNKLQGASGESLTVEAQSGGAFIINTNGTSERVRVDSAGRVLLGTGAAIANAGGAIFQTSQSNNNWVNYIENYASSGNIFGTLLRFSGSSPDDNTSAFMKFQDGGGTVRLNIYSDGDLYNHDGTYAQISDRRIKDNITDANSQWEDIKAMRFVNYQRKDDIREYGESEAKVQLGLIGQELEAISPSLVRSVEPDAGDIISSSEFGSLYVEGDDIPEGKQVGDVKEVTDRVKGVAYSILYMKAVKALQEAMTRIETLEAKVTALENAE